VMDRAKEGIWEEKEFLMIGLGTCYFYKSK
jgi:hypothetical protein